MRPRLDRLRAAAASRYRSPGYRPTGGVEISQHARFPCVVSRHDGRLQGAGRGVPGVRAFAPRSFRVVRRSRTGRSFHDGVFPRASSAPSCFLLRVFFPHRLGSARPGVGWHACLHRSRPRNRARSSAISQHTRFSCVVFRRGGRCQGFGRGVPGVLADRTLAQLRPAASRHAPPSRVLLASPAPRSLAFAPPPRAADVSCALSLVPVAPALRHGLNSAPCPRVLGPLRSSCGCIRHVRQERSSGWLEVPRRSRSAGDRTRPGGTRPRNRVSCPLGER